MKLKQATSLALSNMGDCIQQKKVFGFFLVTIYNQLTLLTTFGNAGKIKLAGVEKPYVYKKKAVEIAKNLGKMFQSNCRINEQSL